MAIEEFLIPEVVRFGFSDLFDDGTKKRLENLLGEVLARRESGPALSSLIDRIIRSPKDRNLLKSGEENVLVREIVEMLVVRESIDSLLIPSLHSRPLLVDEASYLGVLSSFTPIMVESYGVIHLRSGYNFTQTLCGRTLTYEEAHTLTQRGTGILQTSCPECLADNSSLPAGSDILIGTKDQTLLETQLLLKVIAASENEGIPFARKELVEGSSKEFSLKVDNFICSRVPYHIGHYLFELDPATRFANLFYITRNYSSSQNGQGDHFKFLVTLRGLVEDIYPDSMTSRWPLSLQERIALDAFKVSEGIGGLASSWLKRQMRFTARVSCHIWPLAIETYLSKYGIPTGEAGEDLVTIGCEYGFLL